MSPRDKRCLTYEEAMEDDDIPYDEEERSDGGTTQNVADLGMLGDVLLDILDELCRMHELLRQLGERGFQASQP